MTFKEKKQLAKDKDIVEYLNFSGISTEQHGAKHFASSPFSRDSNWSFCIYPSNTYFDWSTGYHGDIIDLVKRMESVSFVEAVDKLIENDISIYKPNYKAQRATKRDVPFDYSKYINNSKNEIKLIDDYANGRAITDGYYHGVFFTRNDGKWVRHPALMFLHCDVDLQPSGVKFRKVIESSDEDGDNGPRFSARGHQGLYILENIIEDSFESPVVYLVESETSANSLWEYTKRLNKSCVVISFGGVSSAPKNIPDKYREYELKIIIDYDGNEDLYNERLKNYSHLNGEPIKLILPKGEDINSLYCKNKINLIKNSIL